MGFGKEIKKIRTSNGDTLRVFFKKLSSSGFKKDISQYSKIEREIQNPQTKEEFDSIIKALGLSDKTIIRELEKKAQRFILEKKIKKEELIPAFLPKDIKTAEQLDKIIESIEGAYKPDFSEDLTLVIA